MVDPRGLGGTARGAALKKSLKFAIFPQKITQNCFRWRLKSYQILRERRLDWPSERIIVYRSMGIRWGKILTSVSFVRRSVLSFLFSTKTVCWAIDSIFGKTDNELTSTSMYSLGWFQIKLGAFHSAESMILKRAVTYGNSKQWHAHCALPALRFSKLFQMTLWRTYYFLMISLSFD